MKTNFGVAITTLAGVALLGVANSNATVTMTLNDPNAGGAGQLFCETGIGATLDHSTLITSGQDWIGIYSFATSGGPPTLVNPFYAICLSPSGTLTDGAHTYNQLSFAAANPGINPQTWQAGPGANIGQNLWGIENAAFLYQTWSAKIVNGTAGLTGNSGSSADQGAALAVALYAALYNSLNFGDLSGTRFSYTGNSAVSNDVSQIENSVKSFNGLDPVDGGVLRPTDITQQDMILLSDEVEGVPVVPEPATVVAGLLLLLPFGATTVRLMRNKARA